jgi:heterotetrameric sarcosine oxidase delta subunit
MKAPPQESLTENKEYLPLSLGKGAEEAAMLRISCPYCGVRDEPEFTFGGPSHITRPAFEVDDTIWTSYLFARENPAGIQLERWLHLYGCGRWFNVARDTMTHKILKVYPMGDPKPALPDPP